MIMKTKPNLEHIFREISDEREYQISRWGTEVDAKLNTPSDWVAYITEYSTKWMSGLFRPYPTQSLQAFRKSMIKVATLAVAAVAETDKILSGENVRDDIHKND